MTLQNEKFEELISQELHRQLEPHRGRAAAAFRAQLAAEAADAKAATAGGSKDQKSWARRNLSRAGTLLWIAAPSALAAALALAVTLHYTGTGATVPPPNNGTTIASGMLDGTSPGKNLFPDNGPVRLVAGGSLLDNPGTIPLSLKPDFGQPAIRTVDYVEPAGHAFPLGPQPDPNNSPRLP